MDRFAITQIDEQNQGIFTNILLGFIHPFLSFFSKREDGFQPITSIEADSTVFRLVIYLMLNYINVQKYFDIAAGLTPQWLANNQSTAELTPTALLVSIFQLVSIAH